MSSTFWATDWLDCRGEGRRCHSQGQQRVAPSSMARSGGGVTGVIRGTFRNSHGWEAAGGVGETTAIKRPLSASAAFFLVGENGPPPPRRVSSRVSGPPTAGGGLHRLQHRRANRAVAVSATNPNIKWHITLAAPRTRTQRPP